MSPPPSGGAPGGLTMNFARLDELGNPQLVRELVELFVEDVSARLRQLGDAHASGSKEAVARVAHGVKGACGNLGAERMASLAEAIEQAPEGAPEARDTAIRALNVEFDTVRNLLLARVAR